MVIRLQQIRIASPCTVSWDDMSGDDRSRFCSDCRLNVYNFAAMTQAEAEQLIAEKEGRVCLRLYTRADGTVITRDCPVGLAVIRRRAAWMIGRVAAGFVLVATGFAWAVDFANPCRERRSLESSQPFAALSRWLHEPQQMQVTMGAVLLPPPPPTGALSPSPAP